MAESKSPAANPQERASDLNPSVGSVSERPVQSTQIVSERIDKVKDPPRLTMSDITEQPVTKITSTRVGPPTIGQPRRRDRGEPHTLEPSPSPLG